MTTVATPFWTSAQYHADRTHDSWSSLRLFERAPRRYWETRITGAASPDCPTTAQRLGTAAHVLALEPERADKLLRVVPDEVLSANGARRGKSYEQWAADGPAEATIVTSDEMSLARAQVAAVRENPAAAQLLAGCDRKEVSVCWGDQNGHARKARFDAADTLACVVVDLKTSRDPGPNWWRAVRDYEYHRQAAWYADAFEAWQNVRPTFAHVVVGVEQPCESFVWVLPDELIEFGRKQNRIGLSRLHAARVLDEWHAPGWGRINTLQCPLWWVRELQHTTE